jgi:hypothetical protein
VRHHEIVAQTVQFPRGDTRADVVSDHVERFGREPAGPSHALEVLGPVDRDAAGIAALLLHGLWLVLAMVAVGGKDARRALRLQGWA